MSSRNTEKRINKDRYSTRKDSIYSCLIAMYKRSLSYNGPVDIPREIEETARKPEIMVLNKIDAVGNMETVYLKVEHNVTLKLILQG